jgi:antitoxin (DNA-binding transcriptional repressor) of toxin-antitoxin stability system
MKTVSAVGVRELRQNLSVYLDRVKLGETLTVTEFRQVVAILRPPVQGDEDVIARLVAEGKATAASRPTADLPKPLHVRLNPSLGAILNELRQDTI